MEGLLLVWNSVEGLCVRRMSDSLGKLLSQSKELVDIQTEELAGLTVAPSGRELKDYHQQLWARFG